MAANTFILQIGDGFPPAAGAVDNVPVYGGKTARERLHIAKMAPPDPAAKNGNDIEPVERSSMIKKINGQREAVQSVAGKDHQDFLHRERVDELAWRGKRCLPKW